VYKYSLVVSVARVVVVVVDVIEMIVRNVEEVDGVGVRGNRVRYRYDFITLRESE
jgi:hypothetical protein